MRKDTVRAKKLKCLPYYWDTPHLTSCMWGLLRFRFKFFSGNLNFNNSDQERVRHVWLKRFWYFVSKKLCSLYYIIFFGFTSQSTMKCFITLRLELQAQNVQLILVIFVCVTSLKYPVNSIQTSNNKELLFWPFEPFKRAKSLDNRKKLDQNFVQNLRGANNQKYK
jgi:hypothetical protein